MAKSPSNRRGIRLGARAASPNSLDLLNVPPVPSRIPASDTTRLSPETASPPDASAAPMAAQLDELRGLNADLDGRWRQQAEQLGRQLQQLEQQRDEIARQTRELLALEQRRAASNRVGGLFALLVLTGVAALGFHGWPWLRGAVEDLSRVSVGVTELAPELRAVRGQVIALSSSGGQTDGAMAALREDVAAVRSDLSSLRQVMDTLSEAKGPVPVNAAGRRTAAYTPPHSASMRNNLYRTTRPMMPW